MLLVAVHMLPFLDLVVVIHLSPHMKRIIKLDTSITHKWQAINLSFKYK